MSETEHRGVLCKRRACSRFSDHQLSEMKKRFKQDPHIKGMEKELMAKTLGITKLQVTNWFIQERRRKRKLVNKAMNGTVY